MEIVFYLALAVVVLSNYSLFVIKYTSPDYFKELGEPPLFWVGVKKMIYLFGHILPFRFFPKVQLKGKVVCTILAIVLWLLIYKFVEVYIDVLSSF